MDREFPDVTVGTGRDTEGVTDDWDAFNADLLPWRRLGYRDPSSRTERERLREQVLDQVEGADSLADLLPWRRLGRRNPSSRTERERLREQVLDQVEGADPLADPGWVVTLAGDWHGDAGWAGHAAEQAAAIGSRLIVQLGDFGVWPGSTGEGYLDAVEAECRRHGVTVLFIDGNHEDFDRLARYPVAPCGLRPVRPSVWHLPRGTRWVWRGRVWLAVGGAVSVDRAMRTPGATWWRQETLKPDEAEAIIAGGPADIMVTHDRPVMAQIALGERPGAWHARGLANGWAREDLCAADAHSALLQTVVDAAQPTRLFHGHMHDRYDTLVDPASWGGACRVTGLDQQGAPGNLLHFPLPTS